MKTLLKVGYAGDYIGDDDKADKGYEGGIRRSDYSSFRVKLAEARTAGASWTRSMSAKS